MNMEPAIVISELTKVFRDFWRRPKTLAVDHVSLQVRAGGVFGLLGPNGSGKSTTLKILLGLLHPTSGSVQVLGQPPTDVGAKRHIGYLPEESYIYGYLTPRETLAFHGRLCGLAAADIRERTAQLLSMVGLSHAADRPVGEFSKGMARRIGLAQALLNDPQLVILDEPTSGLDPVACRQVKDLMVALAHRGKTVVVSSHLLADVEDVCDDIAILSNGRVRALGRVADLLRQPGTLRLTVPVLPADLLKKLIADIRTETGAEPGIDHPSMNLEQFFLQVVREAERGATALSGASSSGVIAPFLAHE